MSDQFVMRSTGGSSAEILMYGDLGAMFKGMTAKDFAERVRGLGKVSEINLRINSEGGAVFDAVAIYNTLMRHQARVVVDIDGVAASSASLVAMAGDRIRMAEDSVMMIHDPWTPSGGTAAELREKAATLDKLESTVRSIYAKRTKLSDDEIDVLMANETWMTADEAVHYHFADEITRALKVAARVDPERYKHTPRRLIPAKESTIAAYKKRVAELH